MHVREKPQNDAVTGPPLMDLAEELADGKTSAPRAFARAQVVIAAETARP